MKNDRTNDRRPTRAKARTTRGGYPAGPKKVSELKPPPTTLGVGSVPNERSSDT
jgi:hypothetical protein